MPCGSPRACAATYWLLGGAEDGYGDELERVLAGAPRPRDPASRRRSPTRYAAADAVCLPSTWEGFGNATVESAVHRKPLAIGDYPVARELARVRVSVVPRRRSRAACCDGSLRPTPSLLDHNAAVAERYFNLAALPARLGL